MEAFDEYMAGKRESLPRRELDRMLKRYEWFTSARRARMLLYGGTDARLTLPLISSPTVPPVKAGAKTEVPAPRPVDCEAVTGSEKVKGKERDEKEIIDRFLDHGGYRIVPSDDRVAEEVRTVDVFEAGDGEFLTEELAGIYCSQGLYSDAIEIYRKLSLLNPEKSIYFADIISRTEQEINKLK